MYRKILKIELYGNYILHIIVSESIQEARDCYNKLMDCKCEVGSYTTGMHSHNEDNEHESYMFITPRSNYATIAHESFHATVRVMNSIGAELNDGSEESYAYLLDYIFDKVVQAKEKYISKLITK